VAKAAKTAQPKHARQRAWRDAKRAAGAQVKLTVDLAAAPDLAAWRTLEARFPDLSKAAVVKLALRELAAKRNRR